MAQYFWTILLQYSLNTCILKKHPPGNNLYRVCGKTGGWAFLTLSSRLFHQVAAITAVAPVWVAGCLPTCKVAPAEGLDQMNEISPGKVILCSLGDPPNIRG